MDLLAQKLQAALGSEYEITGLLGRGGMGAVYRATDRRLRREVAIKVLPPALGYSEEARARFVREARIAAGLSHPNIVSIHDVGEADELVWFVMALVEGESLAARVEREGALPISLVRRVLEEVAQALGYAHARGVVHRDIKPDNVLLDRATGRAMVTDFGIAIGGSGEEEGLTGAGELLGTARYMAPEQALGELVDARADQYALGLVACFMLTGRHAIQEASLQAVIARHAKSQAVDLDQLDRRLPITLRAALTRCLAARPQDRYERVEQLAETLGELGGNLPDTPAPIRTFLRETERTFLFLSLVATAVGFIGSSSVPPFLLAVLGTSALGPWAQAIEKLRRHGITWPMIRRAVYLERARRVEEVEKRTGQWSLASASGILLIGGVFFWLFLGGFHEGWSDSPDMTGMAYPPLLDWVLSLGGLFAIVLVDRTFRIRKRPEPAPGSVGGGDQAHLIGSVEVEDWRFPRWLDRLGNWLFADVVRDGWRIRLERDTLPPVSAELTLGAIQGPLKRIRGATRAGDSEGSGARRAAEELAAEGKTLLRRLEPLLGRLARLQDGVLASRTIGLGGSLESELDRVEAEADALRSRVVECARLLEALAASLERSDPAGTNAILERARTLASEVRRLSEVT